MSDPLSPMSQICDFIQAGALGLNQASNLFYGRLPDEPDTLVTLLQYPGMGPEYVQDKQLPNAEMVHFQVLSRAADYSTAEANAYRVWRLLSMVRNMDLGGVRYRSIMPNSSPGLLDHDSNNRPRIIFNATAEKEVPLVA